MRCAVSAHVHLRSISRAYAAVEQADARRDLIAHAAIAGVALGFSATARVNPAPDDRMYREVVF